MPNMSYCRFENTYKDLQDCSEHLFDELSVIEEGYKKRLIRLCQDIVSEVGEDDE